MLVTETFSCEFMSGYSNKFMSLLFCVCNKKTNVIKSYTMGSIYEKRSCSTKEEIM